ncbi:MAG: TadE/TadG family type IV pilus assembly protein [Candidatus Limnocylindrales bacterium]
MRRFRGWRRRTGLPCPDRPAERSRSRGQALVEFSLVIPIFLILLMAVIEFAFLLNGILSINYATRDAALIGAEAGNGVGADCVILKKIEQDVSAPANPVNITAVQIYWTNDNGQLLDTSGNVYTSGPGQAVDTYTRTGSTTCTFADGSTLSVPYTLSGTADYPESVRCNNIGGTTQGCQPGHPGLDTIAVGITYHDTWRTPLHSLIGLLGSGWTVTQSNPMRMEPVL